MDFKLAGCKAGLVNITQNENESKLPNLACNLNNKRPMGHIAHLEKQFKSINTYDYIITMIKRRKKTLLS